MTNPYAPPQAAVRDVIDPQAPSEAADRGTRLGAAILDGLIFLGMVYLPIMIAAIAAPLASRENADNSATTAMVVVGIAWTLIGFIVWCWLTVKYVRRNGQSIGKRIVAIKVVRSDGSRVSLGRIFWLRNVVNGLISIIPLYGIIDLLFIFGDSRQCLHDKIADTIVVKA